MSGQEAAAEPQEPQDPRLTELYKEFDALGLIPLWTEREDLMPLHPKPAAIPHRWRWAELYSTAVKAGELVPVGRGGERRAISLSNPGLHGLPHATPTLWAAIQYLGPNEVAPVHRHAQNAFRFVLEGEGVWTIVDGDPVAMRRGDLLLTPGWAWHGHHNTTDQPMAWLDGLDIPLSSALNTEFFEFGPNTLDDRSTPERSKAERIWGHPGLRPLSGLAGIPKSPLAAYRWEHTDAALTGQLELEAEGHEGVTAHPGHAAIRFSNPTTGADALPTIRTEMHRLRAGAAVPASREVASSVWQVFEGEGAFVVSGERFDVTHGDLVTVPSWAEVSIEAGTGELDLFRFSDAPVIEKLHFHTLPASVAERTTH
ncbi:cupin domain-containing protein [Streptomyces sp. PSKA54]|uniref:Cupin domain-containing protein n=1 Tax=Streptomyces himalayensis subsp. aureolus TaxID=2758039 RepID=A0A7W2HDN5_9ACTN|nr:cupin domain-containing protein [Streptomyces himalayensis]MBA4859936.1 cupin domain-containing protein [Streptomyces himalayensis subsp. aureolus]